MQEDGAQAHITFMSIPFKDHKLRYSHVQEHLYALVRAMKNFKFYILHSHAIVYVSDIMVKSILTKYYVGCNIKGSWFMKVQECGIEIIPIKIFKGGGLCKLLVANKA